MPGSEVVRETSTAEETMPKYRRLPIFRHGFFGRAPGSHNSLLRKQNWHIDLCQSRKVWHHFSIQLRAIAFLCRSPPMNSSLNPIVFALRHPVTVMAAV